MGAWERISNFARWQLSDLGPTETELAAKKDCRMERKKTRAELRAIAVFLGGIGGFAIGFVLCIFVNPLKPFAPLVCSASCLSGAVLPFFVMKR